jgi:hypothetical protein
MGSLEAMDCEDAETTLVLLLPSLDTGAVDGGCGTTGSACWLACCCSKAACTNRGSTADDSGTIGARGRVSSGLMGRGGSMGGNNGGCGGRPPNIRFRGVCSAAMFARCCIMAAYCCSCVGTGRETAGCGLENDALPGATAVPAALEEPDGCLAFGAVPSTDAHDARSLAWLSLP